MSKNEQNIVEESGEFNKPIQLIERVADDPMYVISQVFKDESLSFLQDQLRDWQKVAISADSAVYEEGDQRGQLLTFVDQLHIFIDALYIITIRHSKEEEVKYKETTSFLSQKQIAEPMQVINAFFTKFPIIYIRRELNDLLEAGITFSGTYPDNMNELELLYTYRNVLCFMSYRIG